MRRATWVVVLAACIGCGDGEGEGDGGGDAIGETCSHFFDCANEMDPEMFNEDFRPQLMADCRQNYETEGCTAATRSGKGPEGPTCGATWECPRYDDPCLSCLAAAECGPLLDEDSDEVCPATCVHEPNRTMDCSPADAECTCTDESGERTVAWAAADCDDFGSDLANDLCGWDIPFDP